MNHVWELVESSLSVLVYIALGLMFLAIVEDITFTNAAVAESIEKKTSIVDNIYVEECSQELKADDVICDILAQKGEYNVLINGTLISNTVIQKALYGDTISLDNYVDHTRTYSKEIVLNLTGTMREIKYDIIR